MKDRRRRRRRRWLVMMLLMGRPRVGTSFSLQLCSLWTHSFKKFAFFYCCGVCVCVFVISPRNKIVCKPGRVLFIAIVVACCRSSCCSCCCFVVVAALKFAFFDSFRGVFLPTLPRDLVVAADIVAFPAWQSVKTLSKSSS